MIIAFDANVLLYSVDASEPEKRRIAVDLLAANPGAVLPWQALCEFIAASRKLGNKANGLTPERAWDEAERFAAAFMVVYPRASVLAKARGLHVTERVSFWDSMFLAACLDAGVTRVYSEDLPGRAKPGGMEMVNPFA